MGNLRYYLGRLWIPKVHSTAFGLLPMNQGAHEVCHISLVSSISLGILGLFLLQATFGLQSLNVFKFALGNTG